MCRSSTFVPQIEAEQRRPLRQPGDWHVEIVLTNAAGRRRQMAWDSEVDADMASDDLVVDEADPFHAPMNPLRGMGSQHVCGASSDTLESALIRHDRRVLSENWLRRQGEREKDPTLATLNWSALRRRDGLPQSAGASRPGQPEPLGQRAADGAESARVRWFPLV